MKTQEEMQSAAEDFAQYWAGRGDEKQESQRFWIGLLQNVLGVVDATKIIDFEKRVKIGATKFIDGYIAETRTIIEQKGAKIDIDHAEKQSDGTELTPFEQAKRYNDNLPFSERAKWIVVSNFREIRIYDMDTETPEAHFERILLEELPREYYRLEFLVDKNNENIRREEEISKAAGELVGKLYDAILPEYIEPNESSLRSLNILCVRIVFCLYAEDAGLFASRTSFEDYIKSFAVENLRDGIIKLFKALDTKIEARDKYDTKTAAFPYVNGGLFRDENIEIPNFTAEIVDVICKECAPFNWSEISPTIFGAVFESTLNPDTRRKGGMHYTSIENIHKVIDPLFLDDLKAELAEITGDNTKGITGDGAGGNTGGNKGLKPLARKMMSLKERREAIAKFQDKISSLTFLDPACGSGNFLTESYLSLAKLEIAALEATKDTGEMFVSGQPKVDISQFYGIEINDFAVTVAKTALWIAESQVNSLVNAILQEKRAFLPLKTSANIVEGNALRLDWATLQDLTPRPPLQSGEGELDLFSGFTTHVDGSYHHYDYIMGNPPFVGARLMSESQKNDVLSVFGNIKNIGNLDYVSCWYKKAALLMKDTATKTALVSTNSITQGEQVAILWKNLFENDGVHIDFAYRTFRWDSESSEKAHVHCVIIGFSHNGESKNDTFGDTHTGVSEGAIRAYERVQYERMRGCNTSVSESAIRAYQSMKRIYNADGTLEQAENINGYLLNAPSLCIESRKQKLCDVPDMVFGSMPNDSGNFILSEEEKDEFIKKEPSAEKYIHLFLGADEFINNKKRYCLWLVGASPAELKKMPNVLKRVEAVRQMRLSSKRDATKKLADTPHLFGEIRQPENGSYLLVPSTSSERRSYIPIGGGVTKGMLEEERIYD